MTSDKRSLLVRIDQTKCAGAESCVTVAPSIFALDVSQLGWGRKGSKPLGMKDVVEGTVDSETVTIAALSCPIEPSMSRMQRLAKKLQGTRDGLLISNGLTIQIRSWRSSQHRTASGF